MPTSTYVKREKSQTLGVSSTHQPLRVVASFLSFTLLLLLRSLRLLSNDTASQPEQKRRSVRATASGCRASPYWVEIDFGPADGRTARALCLHAAHVIFSWPIAVRAACSRSLQRALLSRPCKPLICRVPLLYHRFATECSARTHA